MFLRCVFLCAYSRGQKGLAARAPGRRSSTAGSPVERHGANDYAEWENALHAPTLTLQPQHREVTGSRVRDPFGPDGHFGDRGHGHITTKKYFGIKSGRGTNGGNKSGGLH